jgi:hypothetical protein
VAGPLEQARGGHGPLAVAAHHRQRPGRQLVGAGEGAELDVVCAGEVAGGELGLLADVQDGLAGLVRDLGDRDVGLGQAGGPPGRHAAVKLTGQPLVADLQALADQVSAVLLGVQDQHEGPVVGHQPAQPGRERTAQRDREGARDVPGGEGGHRPRVDQFGTIGQQPPHLRWGQWGQRWRGGTVHARATVVDLAQSQKVVGIGAEPAEQQLDEGVLIGDGQQRVGRLLAADGGGRLGARGGRAERPGAVGGVHAQVVGEGEDPLVQGAPQRPSQRLRAVGADQVGAGHRADQQRPAGEQHQWSGAIDQEVGEMLGGVAGGRQRPQPKAAQVDLLPVAQTAMWELEPCRSRRDHGGAQGGQLAAAGDEVGMQVRLGGPGQPQAAASGGGQVGTGVARGVQHQPAAVAQVDQVGGVA